MPPEPGFPLRAPRLPPPVAQLGQHLKQGFTRAAASHDKPVPGRVTAPKRQAAW